MFPPPHSSLSFPCNPLQIAPPLPPPSLPAPHHVLAVPAFGQCHLRLLQPCTRLFSFLGLSVAQMGQSARAQLFTAAFAIELVVNLYAHWFKSFVYNGWNWSPRLACAQRNVG